MRGASGLTGWGVGLGSVDLTWRWAIMAWRRSLSFASCLENQKDDTIMNNSTATSGTGDNYRVFE